MNAVANLYVAIIEQAIADYIYFLKNGKEHKYSSIFELERFFKSDWCKSMLDYLKIPFDKFQNYLVGITEGR